MPVIAGRTREQIRVSVGYNLGSIYVSSMSGTGGTATGTDFDDNTLRGGADDHNGKWVVFTGPTNNDGSVSRVSDYVVTNNRVSVLPAAGTNVTVSDTYELWDDRHPPARIHEFINRSIIEAYGHAYDPAEDTSLFADGNTLRFDIPAEFAMLNSVQYREKLATARIHAMGATFDETTDSNITQALDTEDKKQGAQSLKLTVAAGASAGDIVTDSISSLDLSKYTHIEGWIKSTTELSANDYIIRLDSGTGQGNSTDLEIINVPAASSNSWTYFSAALANPEDDTAIVSVGLEMNVDKGAHTVWFDDLKAVVNDSFVWRELPARLWSIDKEAADLVLTEAGKSIVGYKMMKLVGGDEPVTLDADGTANEIDDEYVIAMATALEFQAASGGRTTDADELRQQAAFWFAKAERRKRSFPSLANVRTVT